MINLKTMKSKIALIMVVLLVVIQTAWAQESPPVEKVTVCSTQDTYYATDVDVSMDGEGNSSVITMSGIIGNPEGGDEGGLISIDGELIDITTNGNGQTFISCRAVTDCCAEINAITNYPVENLVLANLGEEGTVGYLCESITSAIGSSYSVNVYLNGDVTEGSMSVGEFNEAASLYGTTQGGEILGYVSHVTTIGGTVVVQCDPGPGWCIRYVRLPQGAVSFN